MKFTPIKFDGHFPDGRLEMEGQAFDWKGVTLVVHEKRAAYRIEGDPLCVSVAETGFNVSIPINTRKTEVAAKAAIKRLEECGLEIVKAAIEKSRASPAPDWRLAA